MYKVNTYNCYTPPKHTFTCDSCITFKSAVIVEKKKFLFLKVCEYKEIDNTSNELEKLHGGE